ncbi:MAG: DUF4384 domain-containing protein [Janthinobacterium lividum]
MRRLFLSCLLLSAAGPLLSAQQTPRDAFWSASDLVSVGANPAGKGTSARSSRPAQKVPGGTRTRDPRATAQLVAMSGYGEQPHLVHTTLKTQQLGLRYSILKQQPNGDFAEAEADATFHEGDHVRLSIMSNEPGYLYVIQQGSSGSWLPIFPDARSGSNRVEAGKPYQVPGAPQEFEFDSRPGTEKLFVVLSRDPIADLGGAIERLQHPTSTPASAPDQTQLLEAQNRIPDDLVQRFASRDLTLVTEQKVEDKGKAKASGEQAVYVVAKQDSQSRSHEIVASITLNHR